MSNTINSPVHCEEGALSCLLRLRSAHLWPNRAPTNRLLRTLVPECRKECARIDAPTLFAGGGFSSCFPSYYFLLSASSPRLGTMNAMLDAPCCRANFAHCYRNMFLLPGRHFCGFGNRKTFFFFSTLCRLVFLVCLAIPSPFQLSVWFASVSLFANDTVLPRMIAILPASHPVFTYRPYLGAARNWLIEAKQLLNRR